jgi:hypothetical protein
MKYLILCCFNEDRWQAIPEADRDAVMQDYSAWIEGIEGSGQHLASAKLKPSAGAATLRSNGGKTVVTDGPFAETKEQLGGYHLVECADFDEALAVASRIPTLRLGGTVEVREVESEH